MRSPPSDTSNPSGKWRHSGEQCRPPRGDFLALPAPVHTNTRKRRPDRTMSWRADPVCCRGLWGAVKTRTGRSTEVIGWNVV
jgi:hypothetical protein